MTTTFSGGRPAASRATGAATPKRPLRLTASRNAGLALIGAGNGGGTTAVHADAAMAGLVICVVSVATGIGTVDILAATRLSAPAARARQIAMYLAHVGFAWPMQRVGAAFGRDRTTASHAVHLVEDLRDLPVFDAALEVLEDCLRAGPPPPLVGLGARPCVRPGTRPGIGPGISPGIRSEGGGRRRT